MKRVIKCYDPITGGYVRSIVLDTENSNVMSGKKLELLGLTAETYKKGAKKFSEMIEEEQRLFSEEEKDYLIRQEEKGDITEEDS